MSTPLEIERKFLIKYPDENYLLSLDKTTKSEICQIYLKSDKAVSRRIRARTTDGKTTYTKNEKTKLSDMTRTEKEYEISKQEYDLLLNEADTACKAIKKIRYCIYLNSLCYEIDVFPFWNDRAFMEVELECENQEFPIPDFIEVIKEVTDDARYTNHAIAFSIPDDNI